MPSENLWNYLQTKFPQQTQNSTPIVREAICEVGNLPALRTWQPAYQHWLEVLKIVEWGIPLVLTKALSEEVTQLKPLLQRIGSTIAKNGEPNPGDLAEIDATVLMVLNKVQSLKRIKTKTSRTPDFYIQWDDQIVELEVTKARSKQAHTELHNFADSLANKILDLELPWIITVYLAAQLSEEETQSLLETLREVKPGSYKGSSGNWWLFVQASPRIRPWELNTPTDFSQLGQPDDDDWPSGIAQSYGHMAIFIDQLDEGAVSFNFITVIPGVPVVNYLNRLQDKAKDFQGSGFLPFIAAVDIENLTDGYTEYQRLLPLYLKEHHDISAVLLFQRDRRDHKFGWQWALHLNPDADKPLPSAMLQNFSDKGSCYWPYSL